MFAYPTHRIDPNRVARITAAGLDLTVQWGAEQGDEAPDGTKDRPTCWVEAVKTDTGWLDAEAFSEAMHAEMAAALVRLEVLSACVPA